MPLNWWLDFAYEVGWRLEYAAVEAFHWWVPVELFSEIL